MLNIQGSQGDNFQPPQGKTTSYFPKLTFTLLLLLIFSRKDRKQGREGCYLFSVIPGWFTRNDKIRHNRNSEKPLSNLRRMAHVVFNNLK